MVELLKAYKVDEKGSTPTIRKYPEGKLVLLIKVVPQCLATVVEWSKARRDLAYKVDHYLASWVRLQPLASPKKENCYFLIKPKPITSL